MVSIREIISNPQSVEVASDISIVGTAIGTLAAFNTETGVALDRSITAATILILFSALANVWARQAQYRQNH